LPCDLGIPALHRHLVAAVVHPRQFVDPLLARILLVRGVDRVVSRGAPRNRMGTP
jgi:hypothetical protein